MPSTEHIGAVPPGTFPSPGPIGRTVRVGAGLLCLYFFAQGVRVLPGMWLGRFPSEGLYWLGGALALYGLPFVVDIPFGRRLGRRLQLAGILLAVGLAAVDWAATGQIPGRGMAWLNGLLLIYFTGTAGLSFLLAGLAAVPG